MLDCASIYFRNVFGEKKRNWPRTFLEETLTLEDNFSNFF